MTQIKLSDSFYTITYNNPKLKTALIKFGFKPMENDTTYNTVGRIITLNKALDHLKKTPSDMIDFLRLEGIEVTINE